MNELKQLHDSGQSIWLDTITRELLTSGTLARYVEELSVTGLTSNPTIFERAIASAAEEGVRELVEKTSHPTSPRCGRRLPARGNA